MPLHRRPDEAAQHREQGPDLRVRFDVVVDDLLNKEQTLGFGDTADTTNRHAKSTNSSVIMTRVVTSIVFITTVVMTNTVPPRTLPPNYFKIISKLPS